MRITGLLFFGLQSLSGLAFERISEKNPEGEENAGGWIDSVDGMPVPPCSLLQCYDLPASTRSLTTRADTDLPKALLVED